MRGLFGLVVLGAVLCAVLITVYKLTNLLPVWVYNAALGALIVLSLIMGLFIII